MRPLCFHSRREGSSREGMGTGNNGPGSSLGRKKREEKGERLQEAEADSGQRERGAGSLEKVSPSLHWPPATQKGCLQSPGILFLSWEAYEMGQVTLIAEQELTACFAWVCEGGRSH